MEFLSTLLDGGLEDISLLKGALSLGLLFVGAFATTSAIRGRKTSIPHVRSWIPFLGSGLDFFAGPAGFCKKNTEQLGDAYWATIFGRQWLFLHQKDDIGKIVKAPEKEISMYQGIFLLAGALLPREDPSSFTNPDMEKKISRGKNWDGVPSTPVIVHSVKPPRLKAMVPQIRDMLDENFAELPDSGRVDLFQWCNDLISAVTVKIMLGNHAKDATLAKEWVRLLRAAEPEESFKSPMKSVGTLANVALFGERKIYRQIRDLIYPILDVEIAKCVTGEPEEDFSVLAGMVRDWYNRLGQNEEYLKAARVRIANDCFFFTFAAITNSFAAAAWVIFHVTRNSEGTGDRIRAELETMDPTSDSLPQLESTIYEIGRIYTPGSLMRMVLKPFQLTSTGDTIPSGTIVVVNIGCAHRDADAFPDPLKFDPTRFDEEGRAKAGNMYMPFGAGIHPCVGRRLAVLEIALFVSEALKQFEWTLVDDERPEDEFTAEMVNNIPNHPKLDPSQVNSIWRPAEKVWVQYERKK